MNFPDLVRISFRDLVFVPDWIRISFRDLVFVPGGVPGPSRRFELI